ncbi:MAG TPA: MBL fold metallo-hydrolase [Cyclobacteriaceae bacterium]|nr:MBL fold metallo-hydrolase [Cyclobacteriaceae bacterium]
MSLFAASLNSGSNGNCYYVGNHQDAVLIDAGISCRETEIRMGRLGLSMKKIKAIFITHEHRDHVKGVRMISKKYQVPVYITDATLQQHVSVKRHLVAHFEAYKPVKVGSLTVTGFPKFHDASDPHSFIVANETVKVGVFTDLGVACHDVIIHFKQCHAAFLEANYDDYMLETGHYPAHLKNRIKSDVGHLSNRQALELFLTHRSPFLSHLFLSHISKENNSTAIVENLFKKYPTDTNIIIASRYKETKVFHIHDKPVNQEVQLSLF